MDANQLRRSFTDFFSDRQHTVRPSASLIPIDPTLMLTNAGMVPFKPYFLGEEPAPYPRAVSVQKCVRTIDIDIIGTTARHLSFFEMMGNFSFGDYFKHDAIKFAHEYVTEVLGLDESRLWYTVYKDDDEGAEIWIDQEGISPDRLQRGDKDNFWQMGVPGPCGPASEIFVDRGAQYGEDGGPIGGGEDRFVEIWNLVFMQNIQDRPYHVVGDLPAKSIDTGLGLERAAAVLQDVDTVFEIDSIRHIVAAGSSYTGVGFGADALSDVSLRIIADHARTVTMLISDGVRPSNTGRGYVLRRVLRRAVRHAWQLGGQGLLMPGVVRASVEAMADGYPELAERIDAITDVAAREEEGFRRTLESGHSLLSEAISELPGGGVLSGEVAFKLHDTFGFPVDLTKEVAAEAGLTVDLEAFDVAMDAQRKRAKEAFTGGAEAELSQMYLGVMDAVGPTEFLGYTQEESSGRILAMVREGETVDRVEAGQEAEVFVDQTPFYAEAGGQVGDRGTIETPTGIISVEDTKHAVQGFHGHRGKVTKGFVQIGQEASLQIDSPRRERIRKSHTGTHLLHWALREVVGEHAHQAGSLVEPGRLRFDFSHFDAVKDEELAEIERLTNENIITNAGVTTTVTSMDEAKEMGALAFFGDKYGDTVRVVQIGGFSTELCGGTHTPAAGQVGPVVLLNESSIGSNTRRVEALTGEDGYRHLVKLRKALESTGALLRTSPVDVPGRVEALLEKNRLLEGELAAQADRARSEASAELAAGAAIVKTSSGETKLVVAGVTGVRADELRQLALSVRDRIGAGVVILGSEADGKGSLVGSVSGELVRAGVSAADIILPAAKLLGGGGSRDPELCQAGGPHGDRLNDALNAAREEAGRALSEV